MMFSPVWIRLFFLGFLIIIPASIPAKVEKPRSIAGLTAQEERFYLNGVADGFQIVNAELIRRGQVPLYCIPPKVILYGRDLLEFTSDDLKGPQHDVDIAVSALFGMMKKFPCETSTPLNSSLSKERGSEGRGEAPESH